MDKNEFLHKVREAGIVGAGGAGFPTYFKLNSDVDYLVANAAECEPLLFNDQYIMMEFTNEIISGMQIAAEIIGAKKSIIAIKGKYKEIIKKIKSLLPETGFEVFEMDNFYPAGDEQSMLYDVLKKTVPALGIPLQVGAVVQNVNTFIHIHEAIKDGTPVTDRYLTVNGVMDKPFVMKVPIGTSIKYLLQNYFSDAYEKIMKKEAVLMTGGPMMGNLIGEDMDIPITKILSGILVLPPDIPPVKERQKSIGEIIRDAKIACCNCSYCTELCPRYAIGHDFKTHLIMQGVAFASPEFYVEYDAAFMCCECGICSMVACPMDLSPRIMNKFMKEQISKAGIKPRKKEKLLAPTLNDRKVPYSRLLRQIGLTEYDVFPPFYKDKLEIKSVRIPLRQHIGAPQAVAVKVGDAVNRGQKLTLEEDANRMSVPVHSSIDGVVTAIRNSEICISDTFIEERK